ncbi:uncharacterized protein LOC129799977 [Phlebotomus papatasi]|uniref:uncharacterized protein LOC129799977 n=1 Tax=Phlebotomus papatasi TaxID=29031 RepID=UPI0024844E1E|nr:uncharacterized protein LOC129799977 [Phlebotomus papatasi]
MEKLWIFTIFLLFHTNGYLCADNPCHHILANTDVVDMTTLKSQKFVAYAPNQTYVFSICEDSTKFPSDKFVEDNNPCIKDGGYSLCLYNSTSPKDSLKLAKTSEWKWSESEGDHLALTASFNKSQLRIQLSCLSSVHESTYFMACPAANQSGATVLEFHLFSPLACPQKVTHSDGLSTGSVLMIILLVAFLTYLTIGIVVNLFVLGARGAEVIPNIQFWRSLPGLVMDGARFLQNGCKVRPSDLVQGRDTYDSI